MSATATRVVIVGRDAALWLTAAAVRRALAPVGVTVTAIELPSALGAASAYVSLPPLEALHAKLGLDETTLLRATGGSFSLGHNVVAPASGPAPFFLAHGSYGAPIDGNSFFPYWVKARHFGLGAALEDFCLTAMAARQGRMLLPDEATESFGRTDYGYHLPAIPYVATLKTHAARLGVTMRTAHAVTIDRDAQSGAIRAVRPDDGDAVPGDLFVDASGAAAVLAAPEARREEKSGVTDRLLIARAAPVASVPAYTELRIGPSGWLSLQASPAATHIVFAHASRDHDADTALAAAQTLSGFRLDDAFVTPVAPGRCERPWTGNCLAIGAAARAFDPLFDLELHAVQLGIVHLLALFPAGTVSDAERDEYNRLTGSAFDRLADLPAAFHALNRFGDAGFWARSRAATPPAAVAHKIATYRVRGDIAPMEDETFAPDFWQAMLVGLGEMPESWPPAIDRTAPERMKDEFRRILGFIKDKVLEQPTHQAYLARLSRSEAA